jgi:uncharacterized membrane protein
MKFGRVIESIVIERSITDVFAFVSDLTGDPLWFRGVREVRVVSDVDRGAGTEYEQVTRLFGWRFTARVRMTEYEPPHHAALESVRSATPFRAVYRFEPLDDGRATRYTLDATVAGSSAYAFLGPLFLPLLRRGTRSRLRGLKRLLEQ